MKTGDKTKFWHPEKSVFLDCAEIGSYCTIHAFVWIGGKIGDGCKVQAFVFIPEGVIIGDNVFIGPHTCFTNDKNPPSDTWQTTLVNNGVSIGANVTILPGVVIGEGAIIGGGAVVTKDVPPYCTVVGNPAHIIKSPKFHE